jgi:hypothetical protein
VFRLFPVMPLHGDRDPTSLQRKFESENSFSRGSTGSWRISFHNPSVTRLLHRALAESRESIR